MVWRGRGDETPFEVGKTWMLLSPAETCALVHFLCGREEIYSNNLTQKGLQTNGKEPKVEGT
jgi:hypothetical protein